MNLRSALLAATILAAAPVAAKAQAVSGLYIGAGAGVNFMQDQQIKAVGFPQQTPAPFNVFTPGAVGGNVRMTPGFVGVLSLGYGLGNGLRFEVEGSYRTNKFRRVGGSTNVFGNNGLPAGVAPGTRVGQLAAGGDEQKYGGMFNVLYDFDPSVLGLGFLPVVPYIGGGVGYQWAQHKNARIYGQTATFAGTGLSYQNLFRTNAGEGAFAYQAIAGVSFPIAAVPGLSITAEYRFMGLADRDAYKYQFYATGPQRGGLVTRATVKFEDDFNHSVLLGVRYAFNAAPAPAAAIVTAPPSREAARTYLVFFDWDRADLTDRARQIIAEAAQATTRVQVTRIQVNGHTDLSGTARYNQGLSVRRATNVTNELVRLGVPRSAISIQGFGKSRPLVPTADGVREPQNRRVEIILQ